MTLFIRNGTIATMNRDNPFATAALVEGGRFTYVGDEAGARRLLNGQDIEELDLENGLMLPGFHDSHMHFLHYVRAKLLCADLFGSDSIKEVQRRLSEAVKAHDPKSGCWVVGEAWNQEYFTDCKRFITRDDLDSVSKDVPIIALRTCFHLGTLNSKALELLGIDESWAAKYPGYVDLDESGRLNGIFKEHLIDDIKSNLPAPDVDGLVKLMCDCQKDLFECGITSVQSDDLKYVPEGHAQELMLKLSEAARDGRLKLRIGEQCQPGRLNEINAFLDAGFGAGYGDDTFHTSAIKLFTDGSLGARTAYMRKPYADDPATRGLALHTQDELNEMVLSVHRRNLPVNIHAIGDGAIEQALNAIEYAQNTEPSLKPRHAIIHCQITDTALIDRFRELGVAASVQPAFIDSDMLICSARVGDELASTSYSWKTFLDKGILTPFGTDCPVEPFDARRALWCAVTRMSLDGKHGAFNPGQALTLQQAIYSYTAMSAEADGAGDRKGRIMPGMLADFTVLDRNLFELPSEEILKYNVKATFVGGERVYSRL